MWHQLDRFILIYTCSSEVQQIGLIVNWLDRSSDEHLCCPLVPCQKKMSKPKVKFSWQNPSTKRGKTLASVIFISNIWLHHVGLVKSNINLITKKFYEEILRNGQVINNIMFCAKIEVQKFKETSRNNFHTATQWCWPVYNYNTLKQTQIYKICGSTYGKPSPTLQSNSWIQIFCFLKSKELWFG